MKKSNKKITSSSLSNLIEKFSKDNVIEEMEKQYGARRTKDLPTRLIKDNKYIKNVKISDEVIDRFAKTLKEQGILSPIIVREVAGKYEVVLGRKRLLASKKAGFAEVPCIIGDFREEEILLILLADTRDQRESNVVELALICKALSDKFHYTQQTLGELSHQSRPQITNIMRILRLPESVISDIESGIISYGHAKVLVTLPEEKIISIVEMIKKEKLSVREVERICSNRNATSEELALTKGSDSKYSKINLKSKTITLTFDSEKKLKSFIKKVGSK
mgnify:CR=1 FL=1